MQILMKKINLIIISYSLMKYIAWKILNLILKKIKIFQKYIKKFLKNFNQYMKNKFLIKNFKKKYGYHKIILKSILFLVKY